MDRGHHPGGPFRDGRIDQIREALRHFVRLVPVPSKGLGELRVAEEGKVRVVELHIAATGVAELLELFPVDLGDVGVELLEVRVRLVAHCRAAAAQQHGGRRNRLLGGALGVRFHEHEVLDLDRLPVAQLADDRESARRKGLAGHGALLVQAAHRALDGEPPGGPRPAELLYEIGVKRAAPVLAVGDRMEPHGFLKPDDIADAAVLQLVKGRRADQSLQGLFVSRAQLRHAQQAPDLVRAERRLGGLRHPHLEKASPMPVPAGVRYDGV